jgi:hypothetical protein
MNYRVELAPNFVDDISENEIKAYLPNIYRIRALHLLYEKLR